jgi:hypothetical protein
MRVALGSIPAPKNKTQKKKKKKTSPQIINVMSTKISQIKIILKVTL